MFPSVELKARNPCWTLFTNISPPTGKGSRQKGQKKKKSDGKKKAGGISLDDEDVDNVVSQRDEEEAARRRQDFLKEKEEKEEAAEAKKKDDLWAGRNSVHQFVDDGCKAFLRDGACSIPTFKN